MLETFPRGDFLGVLQVKPTSFDQRAVMGQTALALGCQKPAHKGEYLVLDAVAMMLVTMLNYLGVELKPAADAVRENWEGWLELVTRAERPMPEGSQLFFCVAVLWLDGRLSHRVVMGEAHKITAALTDESIYRPAFVSMHRVLRQLRANAQHAKITLPERFTIAPDEAGYENWRAAIRAYQQRAGARLQAKAKGKTKTTAKGQRPARAAARKLLKA